MATIKIAVASAAQLANFARVYRGIDDAAHQHGAAKLIDKIRATGWDKDYIELEGGNSQDDTGTGEAGDIRTLGAKSGADARRFVTINIPEQDASGGADYVPVAVNGKAILLPRGEDIRVPQEYVEALRHAVQFVYPTDHNGKTLPPRKMLSYPFNVVAA